MHYQIELFEESSLSTLQKDVNDFLMLLSSERVVKITFNKVNFMDRYNRSDYPYNAMVVYSYDEE